MVKMFTLFSKKKICIAVISNLIIAVQIQIVGTILEHNFNKKASTQITSNYQSSYQGKPIVYPIAWVYLP